MTHATALQNHRLMLGGRSFLPLMLGGMGTNISTAELALAVERLGGIAHLSDAMLMDLSDRLFGTRFTAEKAKRTASERDNMDKSAVTFNLDNVKEAARRYVSDVMSRATGHGLVLINCMEKLTMNAGLETLRARLTAALDGGIDGITLSAGLHLSSMKLMADHPRFKDALVGIIVSSSRALNLFLKKSASTGRLPFLEETEEGLAEKLAQVNPEIQLDRFLLDAYFGISPLMARELSFRACGETDGRLCNLDEAGKIRFQDAFFAFANCVKENNFTPIVLKREGVPFEFSALPVHQYGLAAETETFESFSALLDSFYEAKERQERVRQRGADLIRTATTARDRVRRKLALQEKDYAATQERDALRLSGDLITANLYRMERGESKLVCQNYYDEDLAEVTIPLDPLLTPQQNAAKYYKRYTKAKTAERYLREQMALARRDLAYLESVLQEIVRILMRQYHPADLPI